jgi:hypothetical protein
MTTVPLAGPDGVEDREKPSPRQLATAITRSVMAALGRPDDFLKLSVLPLWQNYYRVNVLTGADAVTARVAHSFFVAIDALGNVTESNPKIPKRY